MELRRLGAGDQQAVASATELFDFDVRPSWTRRFLEDRNHHLIMAYEDGVAAGFVSGVEMTHPDKGTEMFLYELEVVERFRKRGFGTALVDALAKLALERACYGMWVLTDADNHAALSTYIRSGAAERSDHVMFSWSFSGAVSAES